MIAETTTVEILAMDLSTTEQVSLQCRRLSTMSTMTLEVRFRAQPFASDFVRLAYHKTGRILVVFNFIHSSFVRLPIRPRNSFVNSIFSSRALRPKAGAAARSFTADRRNCGLLYSCENRMLGSKNDVGWPRFYFRFLIVDGVPGAKVTYAQSVITPMEAMSAAKNFDGSNPPPPCANRWGGAKKERQRER